MSNTEATQVVRIMCNGKEITLTCSEFHRILTSACCRVLDQIDIHKKTPLDEIVKPSFGHGTDPLDTVGLENTLDNWRSAETEYKKIKDVERALGLEV